MVNDKESAGDAALDSFHKVMKKMPRLREGKAGDGSAWLAGACKDRGAGFGMVVAEGPQIISAIRLGGGNATAFSKRGISKIGEIHECRTYCVATVEGVEFASKGAFWMWSASKDYHDICGHLNGLQAYDATGGVDIAIIGGAAELLKGSVQTKHGNYSFSFFARNFAEGKKAIRCDYSMLLEGENVWNAAQAQQDGTLEKIFNKMRAAAKKMFPSEMWGQVKLENVIGAP